jgi:uncharacterized membrane protein
VNALRGSDVSRMVFLVGRSCGGADRARLLKRARHTWRDSKDVVRGRVAAAVVRISWGLEAQDGARFASALVNAQAPAPT